MIRDVLYRELKEAVGGAARQMNRQAEEIKQRLTKCEKSRSTTDSGQSRKLYPLPRSIGETVR